MLSLIYVIFCLPFALAFGAWIILLSSIDAAKQAALAGLSGPIRFTPRRGSFYGNGAPIRISAGHNAGTVCIVDIRPPSAAPSIKQRYSSALAVQMDNLLGYRPVTYGELAA